jgi:hypothetical protein
MDWVEVLKEVDAAYPFMTRLGVCEGENQSVVQVPSILRVSTAVSIKMLSAGEGGRRVALVFPRSCGTAKWVATGAALALMLEDAVAGLNNLQPFRPGDRVLGDNRYIAEYVGTETIKGEEFLILKLGGDTKPTFKFPAKQRLRLQPTLSQKPLSKRPMPQTTIDPIDGVLGVGTMGNRSIYKSTVLLVSSIGETREWGHKTYITPYPYRNGSALIQLINLFQWGGVDYKGDLTRWSSGKMAGKPVVTVASDLLSVEEYLTGTPDEVRLTILDGCSRFSNDVQALDDIVESGIPSIAVIESSDADEARLLRERGFDFWVWSREDVDNPDSGAYSRERAKRTGGPFSSLRRALGNFRDFRIAEIECNDDTLQRAQENLFALERQVGNEQEEIKELIGQLYGCLLNLARMLRPRAATPAEDWRQQTEKRLNQVETEFRRNRMWITPEAFGAAQTLIDDLRSALNEDKTAGSKLQEFEKIITSKLADGAELLGVIVGNVNEVNPTSSYWEQRLGDTSKIKFLAPSTFDEDSDYDALIVSGWLGAGKMNSIMYSYAAPEIHILANRFERKWIGASLSKRRRATISPTSGARGRLLGVRVKETPPPEPKPEPAVTADETVDISDFELRLRFYRRQLLAARRAPDESTLQARFVGLAGGYYAFLSENYHVPLVTSYVKGMTGSDEIPQRTVDKIRAGDFLLFRESSEGNLIRAVADMGLARSGKQHLRKTASLWQDALRAYHERLGRQTGLLIRKLIEGGCKKTAGTICSWLYSDYRIAPRSYSDIKLIADITGDRELNANLNRVQDAIREVRGAHLQASDFLIKKLLESIPSRLSEKSEPAFSLEIEGVGRAVVAQVEEIGEGFVTAGYSRANRLMKEVQEA